MRQIVIPRGDVQDDTSSKKINRKAQSVRQLEKSRRSIERAAIRGDASQPEILHNIRPKLSLFGRLRVAILFIRHKFYIFGTAFKQNLRRAAYTTGYAAQSPFIGTIRRIRARDRKINRHARLNAIIILVLVVGLVVGIGFFDFGVAVEFGGEQIGFVANQQVFNDAVQNVNRHVSRMLNEPFQLEIDVAYHYSLVDSRQILEQRDIERILFSSVEGLYSGYVLTVDGAQVGVSYSRDILDALIDEYKKSHVQEGITVEFASDVEVERLWVTDNAFMDEEDLREVLYQPLRGTVTTHVSEDNTVQSLAIAYGLSAETLTSLNPELDGISTVAAGTELVVNPALPLVSLATTERIEITEDIPYERTTVNNANLWEGDRRVTQTGITGARTATYDVRIVNGFEESRTLVEEQITTQVRAEIVEIGTRTRTEGAPVPATGNFHRPLRGNFRITSPFGWRGRGWHGGVDWGAPTGTPIYASDAGRVVTAGWHGGYGRTVIIDHGSGRRTLYAHASTIDVFVGQNVAQGQLIARVGSTGWSTGPHLHFEIILNGTRVNPIPQLRN